MCTHNLNIYLLSLFLLKILPLEYKESDLETIMKVNNLGVGGLVLVSFFSNSCSHAQLPEAS